MKRINVYNNQMDLIDYISNEVPGALHFRDEQFHTYLQSSVSFFQFTIDKFKDGKVHKRLNNIQDNSYFSFIEDGEFNLFSIKEITENDREITYECDSLPSEIMTEVREDWKAAEGSELSYTLKEWLNLFGLFEFSKIDLERDEFGDTVKAKFDSFSEQTIIQRIFAIVEGFGGECEFKTKISPDGTFDKIVLNVYKARSEDNPSGGVGNDRTDVYLTFGRELTGVTVNTNREQQYTAIRLKDKEGNWFRPDKNIIIKAADGIHNEFYMMRNSNLMYAPLAMLDYPSMVNRDQCDNWTARNFTCEYGPDEKDKLEKYITTLIKAYAYPIRTYTVQLSAFDVLRKYKLNIGDTIYMKDPNFLNGMLIKGRVSEMVKCWTDPTKSTITLTNVVRIASRLSQDTQAVIQRLIDESTPFTMTLTTDNGLSFKEMSQSSTIYPKVYKGGQPFASDNMFFSYTFFRRDENGNEENVETESYGDTLTVHPKDLEGDVVNIRVRAYFQGKEICSNDITFTNVWDGTSPILTVVKSSNGDKFRNQNISSILIAQLFRNDEEIDTEGAAFAYIWNKINEDGQSDTEWNKSHSYSTKNLPITDADVFRKAVFVCNVESLY